MEYKDPVFEPLSSLEHIVFTVQRQKLPYWPLPLRARLIE